MTDAPAEVANADLLRDHLARGRKLLASPEGVKVGQLRMWTGAMRYRLKLIYGQDSDVYTQFPMIPEGFPQSQALDALRDRVERLERFLMSLQAIGGTTILKASRAGRVFIGHGGSPVWRELKDFLQDRLRLAWDEFNREAVAGFTTFERLDEMLTAASFAFLVMTAEDEHADASLHARENVVHEVGLFQGRLGPRKAIILLEDGCEEFSNIIGLSQIRFPRGRVSAAFEEIRCVLEREGVVAA
jgi:predicted nucleotide-binding protein